MFEHGGKQTDSSAISKCIADAEEYLHKYKHPAPYTIPWEEGGCMWDRNPPFPAGLTIIKSSPDRPEVDPESEWGH